MVAKWSKMKQIAKTIDFPQVLDGFWVEFARQLLQKVSPKSPASPEDSSWEQLWRHQARFEARVQKTQQQKPYTRAVWLSTRSKNTKKMMPKMLENRGKQCVESVFEK